MSDTEPPVSSLPMPRLRLYDRLASLLQACKIIQTVPWTNDDVNEPLLQHLEQKARQLGKDVENAGYLTGLQGRGVELLPLDVTGCLRIAWDCAEDVFELDKLPGGQEFLSRSLGLEVLMERFNMVLFSVLL